MFTKININQFGPYSRFRWQQKMKPFSRVNIIYGRNYSGKTTLSRIFDCVAQGALHKDYAHGQFSLFTGEGAELTPDHLQCDERVRVYNSDFVSRNLSWLRNEEQGTIQPFALIGSENVEAQREIDRINELLYGTKDNPGLEHQMDIVDGQREATRMSLYESNKMMERQLTQKANESIKLEPYYVGLGADYDVKNLKEDIEALFAQDKYIPLTKKQAAMHKRIIDEGPKQFFEKMPADDRRFWEPIDTAKKLLGKKITVSKTIFELLENDLLQAWVEQGRSFHQHRDTCAFCGNPISKERMKQLNNHFVQESNTLFKELNALKEKLLNVELLLNDFLMKYSFNEWHFYAGLFDEYQKLLCEWDSFKIYLKKAADILLPLVDQRLANMATPVEVDPSLLNNIKSECRDKYKALVKATNDLFVKNNDYSLSLGRQQQCARNALRMDAVYRFCNDINYTGVMQWRDKTLEKLNKLEAEEDALVEQICELREERKDWELAKKDETNAAHKITELLANHFGNGSLALETVQEDERYDSERRGMLPAQTCFVIKRGSEVAHNLSDGEKSLISFCYFIAQIEAELNSPEASKLVIFIDDPISSLDNSHIFFMYSLIESLIAAPQRYGQLFISTHNLDFLKYLKRLTVPAEPRRSDNIAHYVIVRERYGDGEFRSRIAEMPPYLRDYVTEYNFLFSQIYQMAQPPARGGDKRRQLEHSYTQYYNIGNNMRRFLECYLFMRYPNADEPMRHLPKLFGHGYVPAEVNRIVNEYSHLAFALRGGSVMEVPEVEAAARHILTALRTRDPEHYAALCESINVKNT